jgi:hypothetical protein
MPRVEPKRNIERQSSIERNCRIAWIALSILLSLGAPLSAQNFGMLMFRKKIMLQRKLPPTGHMEGTTFKVNVTASGLQADLPTDLKSTLVTTLLKNDARLRTEDGRADTVIECRITSFAQPQPQVSTQSVASLGKNKGPSTQQMVRITGQLTVTFQAKDGRAGRTLSADTVTSKFDREYPASAAQTGVLQSMSNSVGKLTKGAQAEDDIPPTPAELHTRLIQDAAHQIASHLVNTTEQVEVYLARGGPLDQPDKLAEEKLWTRALEALETMKPYDQPEQDAYRLYDLGVVNEALAYKAEDVKQARTYLQQAAIDYGKAIDAKPTEKYFLEPQNRIDTALAHYKILGDTKSAATSAPPPPPATRGINTASNPAGSSTAKGNSAPAAGGQALTNDQVISMVAAHLDLANIVDTIKTAPEVSFDLTAQGQVDLAKNGVSGPIITAMKTRARTPAASQRATKPNR